VRPLNITAAVVINGRAAEANLTISILLTPEMSSECVCDGAYAALSRDAYAMSHLSAVNLACTHGLAGLVDACAAAVSVQPYLRGVGVVPV